MTAPKLMRPSGGSLAVVAFAPSSIAYLRLLKPDYRHCMVAVQDQSVWQLLDPLSNRLEVTHLGELRVDEVLYAFTQAGYEALCAVYARATLGAIYLRRSGQAGARAECTLGDHALATAALPRTTPGAFHSKLRCR